MEQKGMPSPIIPNAKRNALGRGGGNASEAAREGSERKRMEDKDGKEEVGREGRQGRREAGERARTRLEGESERAGET
eukprot:597257-Rhodomonas_salina.2